MTGSAILSILRLMTGEERCNEMPVNMEPLLNMLGEYMSAYEMYGYDHRGRRVRIILAPSPMHYDALQSLSGATAVGCLSAES